MWHLIVVILKAIFIPLVYYVYRFISFLCLFLATITVDVEPSGITILSPGENVTLACSVYTYYNLDELEFEWTLNNQSLNTFSYSNFSVDSQLSIDYSDLSSVTMGGLYRCIARNAGENIVGKSNTVLVSFAPQITTNPFDIFSTVSSRVYFNCTAVGYPTPEIVWYRIANNTNHQTIENLKRQSVRLPSSAVTETVFLSTTTESSSLVVDSVQYPDYGYYSCVAFLKDDALTSLLDCCLEESSGMPDYSSYQISNTATLHGKTQVNVCLNSIYTVKGVH